MARDIRIAIRVSEEEKKQLEVEAKKNDRSVSDYIRLTVLKNIKK
jgi:uncharacterized protein (DUF1778 family)